MESKDLQFEDIKNKDSYIQCVNIPGTSAATAGNYGIIFSARTIALEIIGVLERHEVAGTNAGAVTLDIVKVPNGSAISAGTTILKSTFSLKSTANVAVYKEGNNLSLVKFSRYLEPFESIALKTSGTLTDVAGVHVAVYFKPVNNGSYK